VSVFARVAEVFYNVKGNETERCIELSVKLQVKYFFLSFYVLNTVSGYFVSALT